MDLQSHHLRAYFQRERIHPKDKYQHLYSPLPPKLVVTYEWSMSFRELRGYLNNDNIRKHNTTSAEVVPKTFEFSIFKPSWIIMIDFMFLILRTMCCLWCIPKPTSPPAQIDSCLMWIDILFNDQNAIDIKAELDRAELIYCYARYHLVIASASVLTRAWCLFEIMTRLKSDRGKVSILHNWSKGATEFYHAGQEMNVFDEMQASYESDKKLIQSMILSQFGNIDSFHDALSHIVHVSARNGFQSRRGAFVVFLIQWILFLIFFPWAVLLFLCLLCCAPCIFSLSSKNDRKFDDLMLQQNGLLSPNSE
jgi:hypothetical protein